jgi:hypothetical protein
MRTFAEFWPYYVREHAHRGNRYLHFVGTLSAIILAVTLVVMGWWWLAFALPVIGYGFAWVGHFLVERNRPATFRHPFWSLLGDFKMFGLMAVGRMDAELAKAAREQASRAPSGAGF